MTAASPTAHDVYLFHEGCLFQSYQLFGAHYQELNGEKGFRFCVWAPHALNVRVAGDFNNWSGKLHAMDKVNDQGIWSLFISDMAEGERYKYEIVTESGDIQLKSDPYAFYSEVRPNTASITYDLTGYTWHDQKWMKKLKAKPIYEKPVFIYELHLGSWKKHSDGRLYSYQELIDSLIPYVKEHGFTHIELMPVIEHPYDRSWGYQGTGYFSPTSRFGTPHDLMSFIDQCHQQHIGVILDWVPGHFCKDSHGLYMFDGKPVYEYQEAHDRENWIWGTANFDLGKSEVHSFLISNALYWAEIYHIDGFRVDAVANLLYWPNQEERHENPYAIGFLKKLNQKMNEAYPHVLMIAEDSTDWPDVTRPVQEGGLGFHFKWNMGWMNDILKYMEAPPGQRKSLHQLVSFSLLYAFSEHYILPFSHDEVVYGKKSLLNKMPGDYWQKFAQYRLLLGYFTAHPGKKLLFMGGEFAQFDEWKDTEQLDWFLDTFPMHQKARVFTQDLLRFYQKSKILYENDHRGSSFEWIDVHNDEQSIFSFIRYGKRSGEALIIVCNFTPEAYHQFDVGVPFYTDYVEVLNSDNQRYGGSGQINAKSLQSRKGTLHQKPCYVTMTVPPYGISIMRAVKRRGEIK
ncbi:1,4-alpha-glucan branching enzyme [Bacillus atrophaeus]|uniref:1,4-alpha-glucan branching enzyme n=1 Tax=Bacillus atrophaeus TaxID=1452 RepID=UPI00228031CE|nr:1,4-alpha-glucan branching enzyme [Bacillus atrophaeus]MCY8514582.1 1,4-alpha-glucan branching enzyme [Bacillus atrophaeus]MCY8991779.1 1,4-alpha-glucan branching enzyme [Bacillus atrophaeus]